MKVTNPNEYLNRIDSQRLKQLIAKPTTTGEKEGPAIEYVEPAESHEEQASEISAAADSKTVPDAESVLDAINGKVQRLGDFVDTDAVRLCTLNMMA